MAKTETKAETKTETKAETKTETKASAKVYKFKSVNKFLTCSALKVQFINGEATTDNLAVAKALAKIEGVELVEE